MKKKVVNIPNHEGILNPDFFHNRVIITPKP